MNNNDWQKIAESFAVQTSLLALLIQELTRKGKLDHDSFMMSLYNHLSLFSTSELSTGTDGAIRHLISILEASSGTPKETPSLI